MVNQAPSIEERYAHLLVDYSLYLRESDKLYIRSTMLAEPLVREIYALCVARGVIVESSLSFRGQYKTLITAGSDTALETPSPFSEMAFAEFDAFLDIRAPYNLRGAGNLPQDRVALRRKATKNQSKNYRERTANGSMRRTSCQYPTLAAAQNAGMSLDDYRSFVYSACHLDKTDPVEEWKKVSEMQAAVAERLNRADKMSYHGPGTDLHFRVKDRVWINSDGKTNMPSGEVFSAPIEDSVNGVVHFSYPSIYMGSEVEGITLWVEDGLVTKWSADRGQDVLDKVMKIPGAQRFGEVAIGTNTQIDRFTKNILFDEKIGGTVHLALGQAYLQCGGKNESSIHWDMIADMSTDAYIMADGERIYENGKFIF